MAGSDGGRWRCVRVARRSDADSRVRVARALALEPPKHVCDGRYLRIRICPTQPGTPPVRALSRDRCCPHTDVNLGVLPTRHPLPLPPLLPAAATHGPAALLLEPVPAARGSAPIAVPASPTPEPDAAAPALGSALDGGAAVVAATSPVDQSAGGGQASTPKRYCSFPTTCVYLHTAATKARSRLWRESVRRVSSP